MAERRYEQSQDQGGSLRGVLILIAVGVVLGAAYNAWGLRSEPVRGVPWVGEDRGAIQELEEDHPLYTESDDPMAIPAAAVEASGLPDIPDLGRPIQIQLPVVKRFFDAEGALFIDAREPEEYAAGHIPGAIHVSADDAVTDPARLEALDTGGRPIVTYCGGGTCELSINLGWALVDAGHPRVVVFMGGYPEWVEAGYPIETAEDQARGTTEQAGSSIGLTDIGLIVALLVIGAAAVGSLTGIEAPRRWLTHRTTLRSCQLVVGVVMGWAGLAKVGDLAAFVQNIHNFHMVPVATENLLAMTLPWVEVVTAAALLLDRHDLGIARVSRRSGAVLAALMMAVFTIAVGVALARGLDIECGCFGTGDAARVGATKLGWNIVLLAMAVVGSLRPR